MVIARFGCHADIGTEERGSKFSDKFLGSVAFIAPTLAPEFAIEAAGVLRPMPVMPISA